DRGRQLDRISERGERLLGKAVELAELIALPQQPVEVPDEHALGRRMLNALAEGEALSHQFLRRLEAAVAQGTGHPVPLGEELEGGLAQLRRNRLVDLGLAVGRGQIAVGEVAAGAVLVDDEQALAPTRLLTETGEIVGGA